MTPSLTEPFDMPPRTPQPQFPSRPQKTHIMLHHSLTKDQRVVDWDAIRRYHIETNGWRDIGYQFGIERVNGHIVVHTGRPMTAIAAACKEGSMNRKGIHICVVGNYDLAPPDAELWKRIVMFVAGLCHETRISVTNIVGHRDFATYKSCPGLQFDLQRLRVDVAAELSRLAHRLD